MRVLSDILGYDPDTSIIVDILQTQALKDYLVRVYPPLVKHAYIISSIIWRAKSDLSLDAETQQKQIQNDLYGYYAEMLSIDGVPVSVRIRPMNTDEKQALLQELKRMRAGQDSTQLPRLGEQAVYYMLFGTRVN